MTGQGVKELLEMIDKKIDEVTGAKERIIQYSLEKHSEVV